MSGDIEQVLDRIRKRLMATEGVEEFIEVVKSLHEYFSDDHGPGGMPGGNPFGGEMDMEFMQKLMPFMEMVRERLSTIRIDGPEGMFSFLRELAGPL